MGSGIGSLWTAFSITRYVGSSLTVIQSQVPLNSKDDVGHLHPSPESAEASGAKQSGRNDPLETNLYRHCTASFSRNSGNSLIRFGVPDGIRTRVIAVKERRIHDFKGLTRGGRPLSRWKFPVAGAEP